MRRPTHAQSRKMREIVEQKLGEAVATGIAGDIPGAYTLAVEHVGRWFAERSGDLFLYTDYWEDEG